MEPFSGLEECNWSSYVVSVLRSKKNLPLFFPFSFEIQSSATVNMQSCIEMHHR